LAKDLDTTALTLDQIEFENGIILLDKDVQFLLYINGAKLTHRSNNNRILPISDLFSLKSLGIGFCVEEKIRPLKRKVSSESEDQSDSGSLDYEIDRFDVL